MSLPKFDPWSNRTSPDTRAYRAYCAYPEVKLGTLGTIGTPADPNFSEECGDDVRLWLQRLTATRPSARCLDATMSSSARLRISAVEFCLSPWAPRLVALGWLEADLFAVAGDAGHRGGLVQMLTGQIRLATHSAAYFRAGGQLCAYVRGRSVLEALPKIWDLA